MVTATRTNSKAKTNGAASMNDIEASLSQVKSDISALSETLASYGKGKVSSLQAKATDKSSDIVKTSEKALVDMQAQVNELSAKIETRVKEKPMQSLAIAAGIGIVISMIARRK